MWSSSRRQTQAYACRVIYRSTSYCIQKCDSLLLCCILLHSTHTHSMINISAEPNKNKKNDSNFIVYGLSLRCACCAIPPREQSQQRNVMLVVNNDEIANIWFDFKKDALLRYGINATPVRRNPCIWFVLNGRTVRQAAWHSNACDYNYLCGCDAVCVCLSLISLDIK